MKKSAFTMLELVFVIVVVGILAAVMIPRIDRDNVFEATNQVISHIKYTQHLAMTENVYSDTVPNWYMGRWQIQFYACGGYAVHKDIGLNAGLPARAESALDPQTRKFLYTDNACTAPANPADYAKVNLADNYDIVGSGGIAAITFGAGCPNQYIGFDHLGRPYGDLSAATGLNGLLKQNCDITLRSGAGTGSVIRIVPETGYTYVLNYF